MAVVCAALVALAGCRRGGGYIGEQGAQDAVGNLNYPASNSKAAARLAASPRHSEWVAIAWEPGSKDSLMAWVVYPMTSNAKTPVVVVVHEIYGLTTWIRGVADQVAADGFIAIAPDLNSRVRGGHSTVTLPDTTAQRLIRGVNTTERNMGIIASAKYAMSLPSAAPRYAVIGYCWGGQTVFAHAVNGGTTGYAGGVSFYGNWPYMRGQPLMIDTDSLNKVSKPLMLLNGSLDTRIAANMPALDSLFKSQKKDYGAMNYQNATHGFLRQQDDPHFVRDSTSPDGRRREPTQEAADVAATKDGWPRTIAFLKKNLGVK
jgi:carboxymethylenebutenolidase